MCTVPSNFGSDEEIVLATLLALKPEWPIQQSTFFMKYSSRNGEKTQTPFRPPLSAGKITLKIKNRVCTPFSTVTASDGTAIKIEPLLEAASEVMSSSSAEVAVVSINNNVQSSYAPQREETIIGEDADEEEEKPSSSSSTAASFSGDAAGAMNNTAPYTPPPVPKKARATKN